MLWLSHDSWGAPVFYLFVFSQRPTPGRVHVWWTGWFDTTAYLHSSLDMTLVALRSKWIFSNAIYIKQDDLWCYQISFFANFPRILSGAVSVSAPLLLEGLQERTLHIQAWRRKILGPWNDWPHPRKHMNAVWKLGVWVDNWLIN